MKKPCVVSNVIGNRDVIKNGVNGFVCDDVSEFVDAIKSVDAHKEYTDRAYNDVVEKYNTRVMADKYSKIYMNTISGKMV